MGSITWPNTFSDVGYTDLGSQLQANFSDAAAVIDGGIDGTNFLATSVIDCETAHMTGVAIMSDVTAETAQDIIVAVSTFSDKKLVITDSDDTQLFAMLTDGGFQFG